MLNIVEFSDRRVILPTARNIAQLEVMGVFNRGTQVIG